MRRFAEEEIWVRHGEKNVPFRCRTQPFSALLLDCLDSDHWWTAYITGPSQSSKTTCAHLIPEAHTLFERNENCVAGIPLDEMVDDKIRGDLFGIMRRSPRLRHLIPDTHRVEGKGGRIKEKVTFANGAELKPITAGSGDQAAAAYAARVAVVTEAAGFSGQKSSSVETNKLGQIAARLRSHARSRRRLWVEGTLTVEDQLPWSARGEEGERATTSLTRLLAPCPHCGEGVSPDREHLVGWRGAENEDQAFERARYLCPACGEPIDDDQRRAMMRHVVAVHHGQRFDKELGVVGELPPCHTLFFHWTAFHNLLLPQGDIAVEEWEASLLEEGTQQRDEAERKLCQFTFSRPFKSELVEHEPLVARAIRKRQTAWPRNLCPPDTQKLAVGIDVGDWTCFWLALAGRACGARPIVAYGAFDVKRAKNDDPEERLKHALASFREEVDLPGFIVEGTTQAKMADRVWIDGRHLTDAVAHGVRLDGPLRENRWRLAMGAGAGQRTQFYRHPPKARGRRVGRQWYGEVNFVRRTLEVTFNADYWKLDVHEALRPDRPTGAPGAIDLPLASSPNEHDKITNHFANEQLRRDWVAEKGLVEKWVRTGHQHWLDALAMAAAALDESGYSPDAESVRKAAEETAPDEPEPPKRDWDALLKRLKGVSP